MHFGVERTAEAGWAVVRVRGELDVSTVPLLREAAQQELRAAPSGVLLDLSQTTFLDSSGARLLAQVARAAADSGVAVQVLVPRDNRAVRRTMDVLDLYGAVDVVEHRALREGRSGS